MGGVSTNRHVLFHSIESISTSIAFFQCFSIFASKKFTGSSLNSNRIFSSSVVGSCSAGVDIHSTRKLINFLGKTVIQVVQRSWLTCNGSSFRPVSDLVELTSGLPLFELYDSLLSLIRTNSPVSCRSTNPGQTRLLLAPVRFNIIPENKLGPFWTFSTSCL